MASNKSKITQKISPFLWFDDNAEQAVKFYTSVFKGSKVLSVARCSEGMPGKAGSVMTIAFRILGQEFTALNGGPHFKFSEAISFVINCQTQKEVDYYWKKLLAGGKAQQCGWLKDKYGVSWQIVPTVLLDLAADKDVRKSARVMQAMMKMVKLDIAGLKKAYRETEK